MLQQEQRTMIAQAWVTVVVKCAFMAASWRDIRIQLQCAVISKVDKHYLCFLVYCLMEEI